MSDEAKPEPGRTLDERGRCCGIKPLVYKRPSALYLDNDPFCCAWTRELVKAGLIAPGDVYERDIRDVAASDLAGYRQVHLFSGIGVWSYALRLAGWPDDRPVWTASCPCPPFSAAGRKKACPTCGATNPVPHVGRTGVFVCCECNHDWAADDRHLWPEVWRLARDGRPAALFIEQVASADGRVWLASVRASMEIIGYAFGAVDFPASGVGAPHIRQRIYGVADRLEPGLEIDRFEQARRELEAIERSRKVGELADREGDGWRAGRPSEANGRLAPESQRCVDASPLADGESIGRAGRENNGHGGRRECASGQGGAPGELGNADRGGFEPRGEAAASTGHGDSAFATGFSTAAADAPDNFWRDADWILCQDGFWRPVKPGTYALSHGTPGRVAKLRGLGNALVAQQAAAFIEAYRAARGL